MDLVARFFPAVLFAILFVKVLFLGGTNVDVAFLGISGLLYAALEFKVRESKIKALDAEITVLKESVSAQDVELEKLKTHVSGLKLSQTRLNTNARF